MKHLIPYKIFESFDESQSDEVRSYLSQIFLELEDIGYDIEIEGRWLKTSHWDIKLQKSIPILNELVGFEITISKGERVNIEVLRTIETAISYMVDEGFNRYWIDIIIGGMIWNSTLKIKGYSNLNFDELKSSFRNSYEFQSLKLNFRK
jgi:hypothetical protein